MKILFILNDAPYGTEKVFNALRLAMSLQLEDPSCEIRIFLLTDAVMCILPNQETPKGFYNIEHMLKLIIEKGGQVKSCGTCSNARGLKGLNLIPGAEISTLKQLTQWTLDSDKVLTF